jgi:hypothetical protein
MNTAKINNISNNSSIKIVKLFGIYTEIIAKGSLYSTRSTPRIPIALCSNEEIFLCRNGFRAF